MKRFSNIPLFLIVIATISGFYACKNADQPAYNEIFEGVNWYHNDRLLIRNDSSVIFTEFDSIQKIPVNQKIIPLIINDSCLIITRSQERGYHNENREFVVTHMERLIDTVLFDLKYINKKPKLILYIEPFPLILSTKNQLTLPETQNFKPVKFLIANYSIGDQIDRSLLKTRGIYNYPNYTIEDCEFLENKDITIKIIGYNTIFSIERRRIENYRVDEIIKVVTGKMGLIPEYRPMRQWIDGSDYEYEFYRWDDKGVQINLSRSKYIGSDVYKTLVRGDDWVLAYDDLFQQAILVETYRNGMPQSSIIN
jgi:hypothetical protein